jgi:formate-dependent nitrite reductase cytochrome c552 subunit
VEKAIEGKAEDTPEAELRFINPHYAIAAASWLGGYGGLGYQYPGKSYSGRFLHAKPVATCVSCHDPHSLKVSEENCLTCHETGTADDIRISRQSHDGSGNTEKGIRDDIRANSDRLKAMLLDYAARVAGTPMIYDGSRHPYFFADANSDGVVDQQDGKLVVYTAWTPRLLRAAYNWKFVNADHGIHVHNPYYALELIYDSIEDLAEPTGLNMTSLGLLR